MKRYQFILYVSLGLVFISFAYYFVWMKPFEEVSYSKLRNDYNKYQELVNLKRATNATIVGGIGAAILIIVQIFRTNLLKKQLLEQANQNREQKNQFDVQIEEQRNQNEEQNKANRRSLTLDQYIKSIDQLGNKESIAVRLGAIYSLERIMNSKNEEDEKYHNPIIELLASYVRENCHFDNEKDEIDYRVDVKTDIQAIITVLGRRKKKENEIRIDFSNSNLYGYVLNEANLENARFSATKLKNSKFFNASLESSYFSYAKLENVFFIKTKLKNSDFSNASLESTHFLDARLENCDFTSTKLKNSDFHNVSLENTRFNFAKLENSKFHYTSLENSFFIMCFFNKTDFTEADLRGATFKKIQHDVVQLDFINEIQKAKYVQGLELDDEYMDIIRKDFPDLLKRIKTGEGE